MLQPQRLHQHSGSGRGVEHCSSVGEQQQGGHRTIRRRRKVIVGGSLFVLCCCHLANLALGGHIPPHQRRVVAPLSGAGAAFIRPTTAASSSRFHPIQQQQQPGQQSQQRKAFVLPPLQVSYTTGTTPAPDATPPSQDASASMPLPPSQSAARPSAVPRPINLPGLSKEDLILLRAGQRVQHQIRNGCMGSGYVVVDVLADAKTVWESLLDFENYAEMVPTIRKVKLTSRWKTMTKGLFTLSKFRFRLSVVHKHRPEENRLDFYLDPDSDQYRSILEMAEGFWFIDERPADRPQGWTRVYMSATVKVNSLVPMWLVEYAAERALKRATSWLKPYVERR